MLYSMTGFGRAEKTINDKTFIVEIKSLNGKQFDIRMFTPALLKPYEIDIRSQINEALERGSVECILSIKHNGANKAVVINTDLLKAYYLGVEQVAKELNAPTDNLLGSLLKLPDIIVNNTDALSENEWIEFKTIVNDALGNLLKHRLNEGKSLETDLLLRLANIEQSEEAIKLLEPNRKIKIKENLQKLLSENVGIENYDANRLEQELIYYIEKIDISEEQVRLKNHISYFKEILAQKTNSKGKKLSFILQEFGREINTTGSKANDVDIQKHVVQMKDELEKMKEQILNVL
jgi:uncharacterized protein (TIGR00255 family)